MLVKDCTKGLFMNASDDTTLCELFHPSKHPNAALLPYSLAYAKSNRENPLAPIASIPPQNSTLSFRARLVCMSMRRRCLSPLDRQFLFHQVHCNILKIRVQRIWYFSVSSHHPGNLKMKRWSNQAIRSQKTSLYPIPLFLQYA